VPSAPAPTDVTETRIPSATPRTIVQRETFVWSPVSNRWSAQRKITGRKKMEIPVRRRVPPRSRLRTPDAPCSSAPTRLMTKRVMIAAGMLPQASALTILQSTVCCEPWTAVPTLLVTEA
jgi:hypothetical protein